MTIIKHGRAATILWIALLVVGCSQVGVPGVNVPTTGNTANDPSAVGRYLPEIYGYTSINADSITTAVSSISGGASILSGNPVSAAMIAQIDGMMRCYQSVGAVGAKVYVPQNLASILGGQIPSTGVLAVVNQDRVVNNFFACALGAGAQGFSAQSAAPQPCGGTGTYRTPQGETLHYLYAATDGELCTLMTTPFR